MATAKVKKMKRHYLPFEKPLKDLDFEIEKNFRLLADAKGKKVSYEEYIEIAYKKNN